MRMRRVTLSPQLRWQSLACCWLAVPLQLHRIPAARRIGSAARSSQGAAQMHRLGDPQAPS